MYNQKIFFILGCVNRILDRGRIKPINYLNNPNQTSPSKTGLVEKIILTILPW